MSKNESTRRKFLKLSSLGIGTLPFSSFTRDSKEKLILHSADDQVERKLNILCS